MDVQCGLVQVNGARLAYEAAGSGPAVLLIHGFALDSRMWDAQFEALAAARHRAVRLDLRGFGQSSMPTTAPYDHSRDMKALLDHLDIEQASMIGCSMGGALAINFALAYPQATRVLVCVGSRLEGREWPREFEEVQDTLKAILRKSGVEAAKEYLVQSPLMAPTMRNLDSVQAARFRQIVLDYSGWHWDNADPQMALPPPAVARLNEITAPSLILVGEHDHPEFQAIAAILTQGLPKARKQVCAGCAHYPNFEKPEPFNQTVLAFLEENRRYLLSR